LNELAVICRHAHGKIFFMLVGKIPGALIWPAALIVWGPGYTSAGHSHHCVQLVMVTEGRLRIRKAFRKRWMECGAALVRPDAPHEVDARDRLVLIAFVDPESKLGAALFDRIENDIALISETEVARWRDCLAGTELTEACVQEWVTKELLHTARPVKVHPKVSIVLRHLRERLGTSRSLSLPRLARMAGLSESRFMHIFTESVGVPLRPYILWLRLQRASGELMGGASITQAAHRAGFSDASHLTRTFRRMLGTTPSEVARRRKTTRAVSFQSN
jgi:AraC-like DNA-binding protein